MSGAIPLYPLYDFMAGTVKSFGLVPNSVCSFILLLGKHFEVKCLMLMSNIDKQLLIT
jgi:hypothetical protein